MNPVVRWLFVNPRTGQQARVEINPKSMTSPANTRSMTFAWGTFLEADRMRTFTTTPQAPREWEFSGAILTQSHHDMLLLWARMLEPVRITDHLGRTFEVLIRQFDPTERLPNPRRPYRADYKMTTWLLKDVT